MISSCASLGDATLRLSVARPLPVQQRSSGASPPLHTQTLTQAKVSSRVVVDRAPKRSSFVPPVHAFEIAPVSLGVKGGSLSTKPSEN